MDLFLIQKDEKKIPSTKGRVLSAKPPLYGNNRSNEKKVNISPKKENQPRKEGNYIEVLNEMEAAVYTFSNNNKKII